MGMDLFLLGLFLLDFGMNLAFNAVYLCIFGNHE